LLTKLFSNRRTGDPASAEVSPGVSGPDTGETLAPDEFKSVFARLASSISVITFDAGGHLHGFTATSLTPVSLEPPVALFCVGNKNESHTHLKAGMAVGISILASDQIELSARFAGKAEPGGYADVTTRPLSSGALALEGAVAAVSGIIEELVPVGDHTIYLCRLTASHIDPAATPLLYYARDYRLVGPSGCTE